MCLAMVAGIAMENTADAQKKRCRGGGGGRQVRCHRGGGGGGGHCHTRRRRDCHTQQHCHTGPRVRVCNPQTGHCRTVPRRRCAPHVHHDWYGHLCDYYRSHDLHDCRWRRNRCRQIRGRRHLHWDYDRRCRYFDNHCQWWWDYCGNDYYFDPSFCASYDWQYYTCHDYRWNVGISCIHIPGVGYGIHQVYPGSPAAGAGLQPGMIITGANGMQLLEEESMPQLLNGSDGRMDLNVITDGNGQQSQIGFDMTRLGG